MGQNPDKRTHKGSRTSFEVHAAKLPASRTLASSMGHFVQISLYGKRKPMTRFKDKCSFFFYINNTSLSFSDPIGSV